MGVFRSFAVAVLAVLVAGSGARAAGKPTAETTPVARGLELFTRAKAGGLLPAASALNGQPRRRLTRMSPPQILGAAAAEVATRPWLAKRYLARAQAESKRTKIALPADELRAVTKAVAETAGWTPPAVAHDDLMAQHPSPPTDRGAARALRRYAQTYAKLQREHNGAEGQTPLVRDPQFLGKTSGRVPYWDVDPRDAELLGLADGTPFRTPAGKVRIFTHYLSTGEQAALTERFERGPDGSFAAEMTSSFRTLIVYPDGDGAPYMLKFSGHEISGERKRLSRTDVAMSVERSIQLRASRYLVAEPAGVHVPGVDVNVLYRPLIAPRDGLKRGDRLVTWHVLQDPKFRSSRAGKKIWKRYRSYEDWYHAELAPKLLDVVEESFFDTHAHVEVHGQNLDMVIGADGRVRDVLAKDLLDMVHDPAMQAVATKRRPTATAALRDRDWGSAHEEGNPYWSADLKGFYEFFVPQLSPFGSREEKAAQAALGQALERRLLERLGPERAAVRARLPALSRDALFGEVANAYRYAIMTSRLDAHFVPDASARGNFAIATGKVSGAFANTRRSDLGASNVEYGTIHGTPVAVARDAAGKVDKFWFRFD